MRQKGFARIVIIVILLVLIGGISYYFINQNNTNSTLKSIQTIAQNLNPYTPPGYQIVSKGVRNELPNGLVYFLTAMENGSSRIVIDMRPKMSIKCRGSIKTVGNYMVCENLTSAFKYHWDKDNTTYILTTNDNTITPQELQKIVTSL